MSLRPPNRVIMDSINREQAEENHANLGGTDAVQKIKEVVGKAGNCFFCTATSEGGSNARPMSVQQVDDFGSLWFLSAEDSSKNSELATDPSVSLFFQGNAHSDFMVLEGRATVSKDQAKIEELWEPIIKTWFTGGVHDPRITVIQVVPTSGYYWDTKHGNFVAGVKMVIGAATGKTMDDSMEGTLTV